MGILFLVCCNIIVVVVKIRWAKRWHNWLIHANWDDTDVNFVCVDKMNRTYWQLDVQPKVIIIEK